MFESGLILSSPGKIIAEINGFEIYTYGVIIAFAILIGVLVSNNLSNKSGILPADVFIDAAPLMIISGIIGARVWYCILNYKEYFFAPLDIFNLRTGGISIHGAILAGFLALFIYAKNKKINIINLCDYAAPGLAIGQAAGRWGNFFNNEAFGLPYNGLLKLYIPPYARPSQFSECDYFHPAFLYESLADIILFVILFVLLKNCRNNNQGLTTLVYLAGYSIIRFFVELIRVDSKIYIFNLPFPAFVSLIIFTACIVFLIINLIKRYK